MSGIFGFSCKIPVDGSLMLDIADSWNRPYGEDAHETVVLKHGGMGCHIEHFSHAFPYGGPVLKTKNGCAVIDAVLYNRDKLLQHFSVPNSKISDEELLLTIVETEGPRALQHINGDFAGAIYHEDADEWLLFRDHMGIRPLFVYTDEKLFAFSTDIRGLTSLPHADTRLNEAQLYLNTMGYNALSLTETDFAQITCLTPASYCYVRQSDTGYIKLEQAYWTIGKDKLRLERDEDYINYMRHLVEDSVKRRLSAFPDVVGAELSGGLDSAVIDILINRMGRQCRYVSWSPDPALHPMQPNDERLIIADICAQENIRCDYIFHDAAARQDSPDAIVPAYINTTSIRSTGAHLRKNGVRTVFSGHGGDEGISHRCHPLELWHMGEYAAYFRERYNETEGKNLRILRTIKRMYSAIKNVYPEFKKPWTGLPCSIPILNEVFLKHMDGQITPQPLWAPLNPKEYILQGGSRNRLDNTALQGAECGVRYVFPYLDYRVIDFAVSIPRHLYRKNGIDRWIYREAFRDLMPDSLYTLTTKDTPGMENVKLEGMSDYQTLLQDVIRNLDWNFWKAYLNKEEIQDFHIPEHINAQIYIQLIYTLNRLRSCLLLQNLCKYKGTREERL